MRKAILFGAFVLASLVGVRAASAMVDCFMGNMECPTGYECAWDHKISFHHCMKVEEDPKSESAPSPAPMTLHTPYPAECLAIIGDASPQVIARVCCPLSRGKDCWMREAEPPAVVPSIHTPTVFIPPCRSGLPELDPNPNCRNP